MACVRMVSLLLAGLLVLALCGCGGKGKYSPGQLAQAVDTSLNEPPGGSIGLPAPRTLPRGTSTPPAETDLYRQGDGWEPSWPNNLVFLGQFSPQWDLTPDPSEAAYALYSFNNLTEYDGASQLRLGWAEPAPAEGKVYIGLADFVTNSWDWYLAQDNKAVVPGLAANISESGQLIAAVLVLDQGQQYYLNLLIVGAGITPHLSVATNLDLNPAWNVAPLTVNFDCSASYAYGGVLIGFDADWESDGIWDVLGDEDGLLSRTFQAGQHRVTIRATDDAGLSAQTEIEFYAVNPGNTGPTASFTASELNPSGPEEIMLNPAGSSDDDGEITYYRWDLNNDGEFEIVNTDASPVVAGLGKKGANPIRLQVEDNDYATDETTVVVTLATGWSNVLIASDVTLEQEISMAVAGTSPNYYPCVAYVTYGDFSLHFARAVNSQGSSWNSAVQPATPAIPDPRSPSIRFNVAAATLQLACGSYNSAAAKTEQYFIASQDALGAAWNSPVLVSGTDHAGASCELRIMNNLPAIASTGELGTGVPAVRYYLAKDTGGTMWNPAVTALSTSAVDTFTTVALGQTGSGLFRRPVIAASAYEGSDTTLRIAAASNLDGTAWNPPVSVASEYAGRPAIEVVDGRPAVVWGNTPQTPLTYLRADNAEGTGWTGTPVPIRTGANGSLVVVNGRPAVSFVDYSSDTLYYAEAADAQGTAWNTPVMVDSYGIDPRQAMTVVADQPVICYLDFREHELRAAYLN